MPIRVRNTIALLVFVSLAPAGLRAADLPEPFAPRLESLDTESRDAKVERLDGGLRIATGHQADWPGVTLKAPGGRWDLSGCAWLTLDVKNVGLNQVDVHAKVESRQGQDKPQSVTGKVSLPPGEQRSLRVVLPEPQPAALRGKLFGMRGYPGNWAEQNGLALEHVFQLVVFVAKPKQDQAFEIRNLRGGGSREESRIPAAQFWPCIDAFGQYHHRVWPGKSKTADDLRRHSESEAADLTAHPGPSEWDAYGGWQAGPQREATGFFRVEKVEGRWWLVDPEGRLFWSHGTDCVRSNNGTTPITDREFYFADLPGKDSAFGPFYGRGSYAAHGYYADKQFATFNFSGANLLRKYGPEWKQSFADLAHRRLRSWGLNTIANWSEEEIYLQRKTPYTATIGGRGKTRAIEGSAGYWGKFTDVFAPEFEDGLRKSMTREVGKSAGDPWCLGYFVDNELSWGDDTSLALGTLASPADQPAKQVFLGDLQQKYQTIDRLNAAWGTAHKSWNDLRQATALPDKQQARGDLEAFYTKLAERYFEVCRAAVKEAAPHQLYLGCRFAWSNDRAVRAACRYCDVVSFNRYQRSVADLRLPEGCDKPAIIGEFHFGALDRGLFHTGLVPTDSQAERAAAYQAYVRGALEHPLLVGTHWFQFGDQATTGRSDGENYQIGFLDICDTPYPELVAACREVGYKMYAQRLNRKP